MKRWALIESGRVTNVVEQDDAPQIGGEWIECIDAGPGDLWGGSAFTRVEAVPEPRHISRYAFLARFADDEAVDIDLASQGAGRPAAMLRRYLSKTNAATKIDLDLPETRAGVQALEAAGLIAAGRAAEILDGSISDEERP